MNSPGFVVCVGRSGSVWLAQALKEVANIPATHERTQVWNKDAKFGHVEVNSFLWNSVREIGNDMGSEAMIVHLVRDGRDTVRSILNRPRPGRTLATACEMWRHRTNVMRRNIKRNRRFTLETLTTEWDDFARLVQLFNGKPDKVAWEHIRGQRMNASTDELWPHFDRWHKLEKEVFWAICGDEMRHMGYLR